MANGVSTDPNILLDDASQINVGQLLSDFVTSNPDSPFIKEFFEKLATPLIEKVKNTKVEGLKIDLTGLFGIDAKFSRSVHAQFEQATKKLLKALQTQLNSIGNINIADKFDLNALIGSTPQFKFWTRSQYQSTIRTLLTKVQSALKSTKLDTGISVASLLGSTPQLDFLNRFKYQTVIGKLLTRIDKQTQRLDLNKSINIGEFLGVGDQAFTFWTKLKYQSTVRRILDRLGRIDVEKYLSGAVDVSHLGLMANLQRKHADTFVSEFDEEPKVIVTDFSREAINKLKRVLGINKRAAELVDETMTPRDKKLKDHKHRGFFGTIFELLEDFLGIGLDTLIAIIFGGAMMAGGIKVLISGLVDHGPFKGVKKLAGRLLVNLGSLVARMAEKVFEIFHPIRFLMRFLPKGLRELLHGNMEKALRAILPEGIVNLLFKTTGKESEKILGKEVGKLAGKGLTKFLGKEGLKLVLKKIPLGIGAVFGLAFGISRFMDGDWKGGLLEIASGIASIFPGIGTGISFAIDALLAGRDIAYGGPEKLGSPKVKDFMHNLWEWMKGHQPIAGIIEFADGISDIFKGNVLTGLQKMAASSFAVSPIGMLIDFLGGDEKIESADGRTVSKSEDFLNNLWDWMKETPVIKRLVGIGNAIKNVFSGNVSEGLKQLNNLIPGPFEWVNDITKSTVDVASRAWNFITGKQPEKELSKSDRKYSVTPQQESDKLLSANNKQALQAQTAITGLTDQVEDGFISLSTLLSGMMKSTLDQTSNIPQFALASGQLDPVSDLLTQGNSLLGTNNKGLQSLLTEMRRAGKSLNTIASNTTSNITSPKTAQISNLSHGSGTSTFHETVVRDPAYDQRGKVWQKLRGSA